MQKSNECLAQKDVLGLLPIDFRPTNAINSRRKLYQSHKGILLFKESKVYQPQNVLWSGVDRDFLLNEKVSYLCLTVGVLGILLIPVECLIQYIENNYISEVKYGRKNLRIRIDGENFILYDTGASELDLTHYFIPIDDIFSASDENLLYKEDYFHPNDRGYELIAARIYDEMKENTVETLYAKGAMNGVVNDEEVDE